MINFLHEKNIVATLTEIEWERVFLKMTIIVDYKKMNSNTMLDFYMVNGLSAAKGKSEITSKDGSTYKIKINVSNNGERRCYPLGTYKIIVCDKDNMLAYVEGNNETLNKIDSYSHNFLFANFKKVYTINFMVDENRDKYGYLPIKIYMMTCRIDNIKSMFSGKFKGLLPKVMNVFISYYKDSKNIYRVKYKKSLTKYTDKTKPLTILFMTEQSDVLGANLKAVINQMYKRGLERTYEILISARAASYKAQSKTSWLELIDKLAKSDIIFIDDHAPIFDWLTLNKKTKLIQLWHAGAGFKSSGYSRWGHKGCPSPVCCHRQYAYGIAGSKSIRHFFSEVWGINDEQVLPTGMPRMDEFLDPQYKEVKKALLLEQYPMCKDKKVILFAPTYRGVNRKKAYYPYDYIDMEGLYRVCGESYVVLFKMHPWVNVPIMIDEKYEDKFIDVAEYPNINDLFYVTELLITDYSSNIFEYSLMKKPMIFFAFDKFEYAFTRGFHRDYEEAAPGKVCYYFDEVIKAIKENDFEYEKVEKYVEHHFDYLDSGASDRVIDWVIQGNLPDWIQEELDTKNQEIKKMISESFELKTLKHEHERENEGGETYEK